VLVGVAPRPGSDCPSHERGGLVEMTLRCAGRSRLGDDLPRLSGMPIRVPPRAPPMRYRTAMTGACFAPRAPAWPHAQHARQGSVVLERRRSCCVEGRCQCASAPARPPRSPALMNGAGAGHAKADAAFVALACWRRGSATTAQLTPGWRNACLVHYSLRMSLHGWTAMFSSGAVPNLNRRQRASG